MCQKCVTAPDNQPLALRMLRGADAFRDEAKRLTDMCVELASINEAIEHLVTEMPRGNSQVRGSAWQDAAPFDALARELRHARRKLGQDIEVLEALRDQVDAALMDVPSAVASVFPLWPLDVFSRPPRHVAVLNAKEQAHVRRAYLRYSAALTTILHLQLPPLLAGLAQSEAQVTNIRDAMKEN